MKNGKVETELKHLYLKNPRLALEVAKVLGLQIITKSKKIKENVINTFKEGAKAADPIISKMSSAIQSILGFKPKRIKSKKLGGNIYYQVGKLVDDEKENQQVIVKIVNRNGSWEYVVGVPNIAGSDYSGEGEAFFKFGKVKDEKELFDRLEKTLKQAKNFIKSRGVKLNRLGELI